MQIIADVEEIFLGEGEKWERMKKTDPLTETDTLWTKICQEWIEMKFEKIELSLEKKAVELWN